MQTVAVIDYGMGNLHSVAKALEHVGAGKVLVTSDAAVIREADRVVFPGVGAIRDCMAEIKRLGFDKLLREQIATGKPVLGICVGMQVMFETGVEHGIDAEGLGQWPGSVTMLEAPTLPHIGWSKVSPDAKSVLFDGVADERFYFVHSYAAKSWELDIQPPFVEAAVTWSEHGQRFLAAVENGPLSATQFHPEKSGEAGLQLLRNWIRSI